MRLNQAILWLNKYTSITLVMLSTCMPFSVISQDLTDATEIINQANLASYYAGDDGSAQARMIIVDEQGNKQMRQFTILRKDQEDHGDQNMMIYFSRPSDVKGTVFRVTKKVKSEDDRWLYLPALDLVKRISAGDKRTSFVGSHFYYEDVSGRNPREDNYTLLTEKSQGDFYFVMGKPKAPSTVEFDYTIAKIDKKTMLPMEVTYFDRNDEKIRAMTVLKTKEIQGFTTVIHSKITQYYDNSYTEMQFRKVKYNNNLPDDVFSERSLRQPPKAWLK